MVNWQRKSEEMADLETQLEYLRRHVVARIDAKYAVAGAGRAFERSLFAEEQREEETAAPQEWFKGEEIQNDAGVHFQTTRFWDRHRRHGAVDISTLAELPHDLLDAVSEGTVVSSDPRRWAFLDTETTGLAGGTGTYAFLTGLGYITDEGFRLKQYFIREPGEESSALTSLAEDLAQFDTFITYNGKAFDQPLLETRFRMSRLKIPFSRMSHLDLLFGARRLWKLRLDNCRLVELEGQILGVHREGDVPGELIPYLYFDYLRKKEIARLVPVFHHNAIDILTLACLTAIVPYAFRDPDQVRWAHSSEMIGLARWMRKEERLEEALAWMKKALTGALSDDLMFRTMWDVARLERKLQREAASIAMLVELAQCRNAFRVQALEELAKYYEHRERNYRMAMEFTLEAIRYEDSGDLRHRAQRLERKLAGRAVPRLL